MQDTMQQHEVKINSLLPGARIIKLKGYSSGNEDYQKAKTPVGSWKKSTSLSGEEIADWINKGGWIGAVIPKGRILIDLDNKKDGELLKELLEGENVHHHAIHTPNGYQFIFKCEADKTKKIKQISKWISRLGLLIDTRTSEAGYIVFPTESTQDRYLITQSMEQLDELPQYLRLVWNGAKNKNYPSFPIDEDGSRNSELFDFARRLSFLKVPETDTKEALTLIYKYFVTYKDGFPPSEIETLVNSAIKKVGEKNEGQQQYEQQEMPMNSSEPNNSQLHHGQSIIIPKPFTVDKNGALYEEREDKDGNITYRFVSRKTPYVNKEFHNVEHLQKFYEVEWKEHGTRIKEIVPASTLSTRKELLELSNKGLSVNDNNVKKLISFLDYYMLLNDIPPFHAVERLGNIKNKFIHPLLTNEIKIMATDYGEKQLLEAFEVKGTSETWKQEVFERIKDQPKAAFMVLSSFASVVIKDLGIQPFIVDLSGSTSQGKTTTLKAAATVWGNENLMSEWNITKVSVERKAAFLNSYPLLIDDTRKAKEKDIQSIVYQFSGGRSKGRGSVKGSQREFTWNNILLSTGEVSLNEYARNAGGAAARIIPLIDEPLKKDIENVIKLHEGMLNNYGAIGIDFLKVWIKEKNELISEYHLFRDHYQSKSSENEVLSRLAGYYAAVHFVGSILKNKLNLDVDLLAISKLFDDIAEENKAIDKPMQFLEEILIDLDSKRDSIYYKYEPQRQVVKAIYKEKQKQLYLTPAYTAEFLGVEEKQTRREWLKRGMTIAITENEKTSDYKLVSHKGKKYRSIALNMELVEKLGFDFKEVSPDFEAEE